MLILRFLNQFTRHGGIIFFCILYIAIIKETPRGETLNLMRFFSVITTGISTRAHVMQKNHEILWSIEFKRLRLSGKRLNRIRKFTTISALP